MEIVSTMGTGSFGREVELETFVDKLENELGESVESDFHGSSMVTVRLESGGPAYTIYRTGTFQIRGAEDEQLLNNAEEELKKALTQIGFDILDYEFQQVTSVFLEDMEHYVNLEALAVTLGLESTEYEPEQFPGLIYRPTQFEVTLLIFASGKVIIGGTTDRDQARTAIQHLQSEFSTIEGI